MFYLCKTLIKQETKTMARPIKETPVLKGEDARRFVERMNEIRTESPEKRRRRLANYKLAMSILVNR